MGRGYKFGVKTVTISFRIPKDLFMSPAEYKDLRVILTDYIEKFYENFQKRKKFRDKMKRDIYRGFHSFSEFNNRDKKLREEVR